MGKNVLARPLRPRAIAHALLAGPTARRPAANARREDQSDRPARQCEVDHRHAVLCASRRRRRLGTIHLDRVRHERASTDPPRKREDRAADEPAARPVLPRQHRPRPTLASHVHRTRQRSRDRVVRHRPTDPRPPAWRQSPNADRVRRLAKRLAHVVGRPA